MKWFDKIKKIRKKIKKKKVFSVEEEASKRNMTVDDYRKKVLLEKEKVSLNEIYALHEEEMNIVLKDKKALNEEVLNSKERMQDFKDLEKFMQSL